MYMYPNIDRQNPWSLDGWMGMMLSTQHTTIPELHVVVVVVTVAAAVFFLLILFFFVFHTHTLLIFH